MQPAVANAAPPPWRGGPRHQGGVGGNTGNMELIKQGIPVVATSQCLYERSDLTKYEVGRQALVEGAISAHDMTSESAITKLMWGLGQGMNVQAIANFFATDVAGEVTLD